MKIKLLLLCGFTVLASFAAKANNTPGESTENTKKSDILGGVSNSGTRRPLNSVSVTAYLTSKKEKTVITDSNGNYSFDDLKPGMYKFVFEKEGYKKVTKDKVMIKTDEGFQLNIEMTEQEDFAIMPGTFF